MKKRGKDIIQPWVLKFMYSAHKMHLEDNSLFRKYMSMGITRKEGQMHAYVHNHTCMVEI